MARIASGFFRLRRLSRLADDFCCSIKSGNQVGEIKRFCIDQAETAGFVIHEDAAASDIGTDFVEPCSNQVLSANHVACGEHRAIFDCAQASTDRNPVVSTKTAERLRLVQATPRHSADRYRLGRWWRRAACRQLFPVERIPRAGVSCCASSRALRPAPAPAGIAPGASHFKPESQLTFSSKLCTVMAGGSGGWSAQLPEADVRCAE